MVEAIEKFEKWPSGDYRPILSLLVSPSALASRFNGYLIDGKDDLDEFTAVCFHVEGVGPVLFVSHANDPSPQTEVDVDFGVDADAAMRLVMAEFDINEIDVLWKHNTS
jgi:hypothetical protein